MMLTRTSQPRRVVSLLLISTTPALELCNSSSIPSPKNGFFAWQDAEDDGRWTVWFAHCLLLQPDWWETRGYGPTAAQLRQHPERRAVLHASVFVQRHPSSYFPAHPRSLAMVLIPRPAALAVLLRTSYALRVWVSKQKSPAQQTRGYGPECGRDFSSEPPQKARLRPWERGTSRRFAQECPEGIPGKYKQGETQWHSTKTT